MDGEDLHFAFELPIADREYYEHAKHNAIRVIGEQLAQKLLRSDERFTVRLISNEPEWWQVEAMTTEYRGYNNLPRFEYHLELGIVRVRHVEFAEFQEPTWALPAPIINEIETEKSTKLLFVLVDRATKWRRYFTYAQVQSDIENFNYN